MGKRRKFYILCAVLAGVGIVLAGAGIAMGGIVHGIRIDSKGIRVYAPLLDGDDEAVYVPEQERLEAFDRIEVIVEEADIRIERSDADSFSLSYRFSEHEPQVSVVDGKLTVRHRKRDTENHILNFNWFFVGSAKDGSDEEEYVTIRLPREAELSDVRLEAEYGDMVCKGLQTDNLRILAEYGDISLTDVQAQEIETVSESGEVRMEQVSADSCSVQQSYGNVSFYDLEVAGAFKAVAGSGDVWFRNAQVHSLDLECVAGTVEGQQMELGSVRMDIESGDCTLRQAKINDGKIISAYGDVELQMEQGQQNAYLLSTELGNVYFNGADMGNTFAGLDKNKENLLEIRCECGDLSVRTEE